MSGHDESGKRHDDIGFEKTDVDAQPVFWFTAALVGMMLVVALGLVFLHRYFQRVEVERDRQEARALTVDKPVEAEAIASAFPEPRLQVDAYGDLARLRAEEKTILEGWSVVDPVKGVARIPVEEAMKIVAERGVPIWKPVAPAPGGTPREVKP